MDAAEADLDAKLYKASADIISELQKKLPLLIWHDRARKRLRTHVLYTKCAQITSLLDYYQEWPQLLDPVLASLVQIIVDGFLEYITRYSQTYGHKQISLDSGVITLPLALSKLVYTLCKVRGYKIIVRLLNNEPRYIAPMLSAVRQWQLTKSQEPSESTVWEEQYITLLWLSHLMLAPFELSTLSTSNDPSLDPEIRTLAEGLPEVAVDVLSLVFESISSPSKESESAVILLVRLALRKDMQGLQLSHRLVDHALHHLLEPPPERFASVYPAIGYLSLLYSLLSLGTESETQSFNHQVFAACQTLANSTEAHHAAIRGSAPARKLLIKLQRACLVRAMSLTHTNPDYMVDMVDGMVEEAVQNYLDALGDNDSPVRMAASKALSLITLKLEPAMAEEIVQAVLGSLSENILIEDPVSGQLFAKTDKPVDETAHLRRNVSVVDSLQWHGLMLTLGHLLFRRSPPPALLSDIIEALLLGLEFEQRSNVGTSLGNSVRDAACFGIWSLSRKYSTSELASIKVAHVAGTGSTIDDSHNVLQLIAVRLMLSACLDPSGNIRRGSSAALQELIGRHPDTIIQGIPVVQVVDYQAVARRSRAMTEVAVQAAALDPIYHDAFLNALLDWRGAKAADADSRRSTAVAMLRLCATASLQQKAVAVRNIVSTVSGLKSRNLGITAGTRHGLLLALAAVLQSFEGGTTHPALPGLLSNFHLESLTGRLDGRPSADLEQVIEAVATLLQTLARTMILVREMLSVLNHCVLVVTRPDAVKACAEAASAVIDALDVDSKTTLLQSWMDSDSQKRGELVCKGRLVSLAYIYKFTDAVPPNRRKIVPFFAEVVQGPDPIEARTTAMECLTTLLRRTNQQQAQVIELEILGSALHKGLNDYSNDQRGDIGSLLRLATLDATNFLCEMDVDGLNDLLADLMPSIVRLAAEKLNKVRHRACGCLTECWKRLNWSPVLNVTFEHLVDVSSESYFSQLMPLLMHPRVQQQLILGLSSSAVGTTEEIGRACCSAFISFIRHMTAEDRGQLLSQVISAVGANVTDAASCEDHEVVQMLGFLGFILGQGFTAPERDQEALWSITRNAHIAAPSMERLEALILLYGVLLSYSMLRIRAVDKLTRQLLHRFPKIRNAAADALWLDTRNEILVQRNWNAAAAANKPQVLSLRKSLGITKTTVSSAAA